MCNSQFTGNSHTNTKFTKKLQVTKRLRHALRLELQFFKCWYWAGPGNAALRLLPLPAPPRSSRRHVVRAGGRAQWLHRGARGALVKDDSLGDLEFGHLFFF
jgi:hypothetical protein